jgi:hypothetical protein
MPIAVTCSCGARLEIDDKFAGQSIPCPDCHKPILAQPPLPPPTRTSGLAVLSLLMAIVGAFTIVGTLAAMACGAIAYRQLTRKRSNVGGVRIAQAGMILGAVFTVLAVAAYGSRSLLGVDSLLRRYLWANRLEYKDPLAVTKPLPNFGSVYSLERPSLNWGVCKENSQRQNDVLMYVDLRDDAYILWMTDRIDPQDDAAIIRDRAVQLFQSSDYTKMIGKLPEQTPEPRNISNDNNVQEFFLDVVLSGIPRTFLFWVKREGNNYINVLVCGTRTHRFRHLDSVFRQTIDSFTKQEK